jgi:hypothetical protein
MAIGIAFGRQHPPRLKALPEPFAERLHGRPATTSTRLPAMANDDDTLELLDLMMSLRR